ncbi:alpha/beta fold hydrolase [Kribbella sp. CWNU-51]
MEQDAGVRHIRLTTGVSLSYTSTGLRSATPVLLLHAWAESRRSFDRLLRLLPNTVHAIAIDQRGHGDAERPAAGYSLENLAEDVEAFMNAVGISSAVLLGSSSGGYVAQQVAISSPNRVAGLVLVGSPRTLQGRPSFADEVEQLTDPIDTAWVRKSLTWFPRFHRVPRWYIDDRVRDGVRIPAHVWREAFNGLTAARPPTDAATITAPTLILWGDHDELLTRDHEERLAAAIPDSRLVVYEDTGHLVLWEQPERLASDLTSFIESLDE